MQLVSVAEDNWTLSGMAPHTGAICPTDLSTAALANWKANSKHSLARRT